MNILFVKPGEKIGKFYEDAEIPLRGDEVYLDGEDYIVENIKHFPDAGKGIKEYEFLHFCYTVFTRVLLIKKI